MLNGVPVESTEPTITAVPVGMPPPSGKAPGWKRALSILIIVIGVAITLIPAYRMIAWTATDLAQGRFDGKDMRTGLHQQEAIDDIAEVVGGYIFLNVCFYDEYIIVAAPTYPGAETIDTYMWRYGRAWREGPDLIQPSEPFQDVLFDASRIDLSIVGQLVNASKADAGWMDYVSWYPSIMRFPGEDPQINISLSTLYYSGYYRYSVTGELLDRSGAGLD